MIGRLPRSRSPPQPNTHDEPSGREGPQGVEHMPRARRACGRNRRCTSAPATSPTRSSRPGTPSRPAKRREDASAARRPLRRREHEAGRDEGVLDLEVADAAGRRSSTTAARRPRSTSRCAEALALAIATRRRVSPRAPVVKQPQAAAADHAQRRPSAIGAVGVDHRRRAVAAAACRTGGAWPPVAPRSSGGSRGGRGRDW